MKRMLKITFRHRSSRFAVAIACTFGLICGWQVLLAAEIPGTARSSDKVLTIGVRETAKPFSYRTVTKVDAEILAGYGGYMVEICRRVLTDMTNSGYFRDYRIEVESVKPGNRFSMLDTEHVDMLCGPDSITLDRLHRYTASHPVFLSGVALVSRPASEFPRSRYCNGVVGIVNSTTAASAGLEQMAEVEDVRRFAPALLSFLARYKGKHRITYSSSLKDALERWRGHVVDGERVVSNASEGWRPPISRYITSDECPGGYEKGPVVFFDDHVDGVRSLCRGDVLFYLGDIDLLKVALERHPSCEVVFQRTTLTREAYGVYFRKVANKPDDRFTSMDMRDAVLYAEFNSILLQKMQDAESILEYEYVREFGDQIKGSDLLQFFKSFQYANNY